MFILSNEIQYLLNDIKATDAQRASIQANEAITIPLVHVDNYQRETLIANLSNYAKTMLQPTGLPQHYIYQIVQLAVNDSLQRTLTFTPVNNGYDVTITITDGYNAIEDMIARKSTVYKSNPVIVQTTNPSFDDQVYEMNITKCHFNAIAHFNTFA